MNKIQPKLVYSPSYDIRFFGLEKLHPFDSCKYSRAWKQLETLFGDRLASFQIEPLAPATLKELLTVHDRAYLERLQRSRFIAQALELPELALLPRCILERHVLRAMRFAVKGTILAAYAAIAHGIAVNLSGGYHHASRDRGEGFCLYSDIAIAITMLRKTHLIEPDAAVLIIDLDAHQGNGLERIFLQDDSVHILDMYNQNIYPQDWWAKDGIDYNIPINSSISDQDYLNQLKLNLSKILSQETQPKIAFYNAGTDIYCNDPLGRLNISKKGIFERDRFVFDTLVKANIPWVMLPSGGYTKESYLLIADSIEYILNTWG